MWQFLVFYQVWPIKRKTFFIYLWSNSIIIAQVMFFEQSLHICRIYKMKPSAWLNSTLKNIFKCDVFLSNQTKDLTCIEYCRRLYNWPSVIILEVDMKNNAHSYLDIFTWLCWMQLKVPRINFNMKVLNLFEKREGIYSWG